MGHFFFVVGLILTQMTHLTHTTHLTHMTHLTLPRTQISLF